ncbi:MAG TPA: hypothetical protein VHM29_03595 [Acidimicrobiia bacterium]|nr:hypothetical protein [Acidimicrobiia bacterium]
MTTTSDTTTDRSRPRKWIAVLLVVVSSIFVVISAVAVWAHRTIFDTDVFMATVEPALEDPQFTTALGDYLTDEITGALDLEERLQEPLANLDAFLTSALFGLLGIDPGTLGFLGQIDRPTLAALAGPIADGLNERIEMRVDQVMESTAMQELIPQVVRRAHQGAVALIGGDIEETPNISIAEGEVRLNTLPIIARVLQEVVAELRDVLPDVNVPDAVSDRADEAVAQLRESLGDRVPDDFGQITLMSEERLTDAQATADRINRWVWGIVILTIILIVVTIVVSQTRRRTAIQLGIGIAVAFVVSAAVLNRVESALVAEIANPVAGETAAALFGHLLSGLRNGVLAVIVISTVIALVLYLIGRPQWVTTTGEKVSSIMPGSPDTGGMNAWIAAHYDPLRIGAVAIALLALLLLGFGIVTILVIGALLALVLWWLARSRDLAQPLPEVPAPTYDPPVT